MRTYSLKGYILEGYTAFEAACRDDEKISRLGVKAPFSPEVAKEILRIIDTERITFESCLGRDFEKQLREAAALFKPLKKHKKEKKESTFEFRIRPMAVIKTVSVVIMLCLMVSFTMMFYQEIKGDALTKENFYSLRDEKNNLETIYADATIGQGDILPEYAALHTQNPDMRGWLSIDYTNIDYPVMYREDDNDYYLDKNFYGENDANGMLILDKRCEPDGGGANLLIHGHNMKSGLMFGALRKYMDRGYLEDHKYINYDTLYEKRRYEIISVFISTVDLMDFEGFRYYDFIDFSNKEDFDEYIKGVKEASLYDTGVTARYTDKLITLSTCDYSRSEGRLVIVGRQIENE